jgi:hypothetical protein
MYTPSLLLLGAAIAAAKVHTVHGGSDNYEYHPDFHPKTLKVFTGDTVIFYLHSIYNVVSGPFDKPCTPTIGDGGFSSGAFEATDNGKKKFVVNVTSEDPMYYYASGGWCDYVGGWNTP